MPNLTITSPGVETREVDLSPSPQLPTGTSVLVTGFAGKGPTNELLAITSLSEFEQTFGKPSTPAERYFYQSVAPLFSSPANVLAARLPYGSDTGNGRGNTYGLLVYPAQAFETATSATTAQPVLSAFDASQTATYLIGKPVHLELTQDEYDAFSTGTGFKWTNTGASVASAGPLSAYASVFNGAGLIVVNKSQTTINDQFEGLYLGIADNTNINPATDHTDIVDVVTVTTSLSSTSNYTSLPDARLDFTLTGSNLRDDGSVSQVMESLASYDITTRASDDKLNFGVFKIRQSTFSTDSIKLDFVLSEKFTNSLDANRQINNVNGGTPVSDFIEVAASDSVNVDIKVNPFISNANTHQSWLDINGIPQKKVRVNTANLAPRASETNDAFVARTGLLTATVTGATIGKADALFPVGVYGGADTTNKDLGSIPAKLEYIFQQAENREYYNIDLVLEAGLGTIHATQQAFQAVADSLLLGNPAYGYQVSDLNSVLKAELFDDTLSLPGLSALKTPGEYVADAVDLRGKYTTIAGKIQDFCENRHRYCMGVLDGLRQVYVQGADYKNYIAGKRGLFATDIYWPMKHTFELINSSYVAEYGNWAKVYDSASDNSVWVPFSGIIGKILANNDANFNVWSSPMAFTRGRVSGVEDIAINPKQKERDQIFKANINPIYFSPGDGFIVMGDATALNKPSAFQFIGVRRLFLYVEKASDAILKYFIAEPNSTNTRNNVVNALNPILVKVQQGDGLSKFKIVCDERNNPPAVIDQGQMNVDVYIAPTRSTRFILATFAATSSGTNFEELIGG